MHTTGLVLIVLGGMMEGLFSVPMKYAPKWHWENIWAAGSLAALVLIAFPLVLFTVPHICSVYAAAPLSAILLAILFGAGWGCGGIFFGLGVSSLGFSIGMSLIMGLIAIGGSVIPMLLQHRSQLATRSGLILLLGIGMMSAGLAICSRAGSLRARKQESSDSAKASFGVGVFYCLAAGLLSALVNFALIYGSPIADPAIQEGLSATDANNAVWGLVFASSYLVNIGYCLFRSIRAKTLQDYFRPSTGRYWILAASMGILWAGGIVVYGRGASMSGTYGPIFGFPIMLVVSILTGNVVGALSGEWRGVSSKARYTMALGLAMMLLAITSLGYGTYLVQ